MREDDDDPKLNALALDLCERATLHRLKADATELAELVKAISRPFPASLPTDPDEREFALLIIALRARDQARRLLALVEQGILSY
ncbi:hypothetical protein JQ595_27060 [Bradyrhizobium japonicum]|uniref:hypothetical protein n=1 Tax=Bradyrhizobium japonicum TaxID=375 RepID=UPI001BA5DD77|nr:hypothetical protein [Bradyrhizobium japonicum]MBR0732416.1 hypothetical protein [Bradyrhizobium japonicum]